MSLVHHKLFEILIVNLKGFKRITLRNTEFVVKLTCKYFQITFTTFSNTLYTPQHIKHSDMYNCWKRLDIRRTLYMFNKLNYKVSQKKLQGKELHILFLANSNINMCVRV